MRRVILLALLALALPTAALANSIDFYLSGGTMTVTKTSVTISSNVFGTSTCNPNCPALPTSSTSGTVSITLPPFGSGSSGSFSSGSVSLTTASGYVFNGTFTSGSWMAVTNSKGKVVGYTFSGQATGTLTLNGHSIQTTLTIVSGHTVPTPPCSTKKGVQTCLFASGNATVGVVPEPGTLGLLGTGLIGLAGIVRRKFRA